MKRLALLLGLLLIGGNAMAATVALWDFDDPFATNGVSVPYSTNGAFVVSATDKSGNGNDLSLWCNNEWWKEMRSTTNSYFGDWSIQGSASASWDWQDLRTVSNTVPSGIDLRTITPTNFTVEAVFTFEYTGWQTLVCRDGHPEGEPSFKLRISSGNVPQITYRNQGGADITVSGSEPLEPDAEKWRHLAATANGTNLVLYLDGQQIGSQPMALDGLELSITNGTSADQAHTWTGGEWAVGRGMWTGAKADGFHGKIDAVAISDETLMPADFVLQLPVSTGVFVPADGDTTINRTISATMYDFAYDIASLELYVDGAFATLIDTAPGESSATVSYDGSGLASGMHTGMVVSICFDPDYYVQTNEWVFTFVNTVPEPAPYAGELYNINFAGCVNDGLWPVDNGAVGVAPGLGANLWNNLYAPDAPWGDPGTVAVENAGGDAKTINVSVSSASDRWWGVPSSWSGYYGAFTNLTGANAIFQGRAASSAYSGKVILTGLETNASYDVYVYWTYTDNENAGSYSISAGTTDSPAQDISPVRSNVTNLLVEGENYVILSDITPTATGEIDVQCHTAGLSGLQVVKRSDTQITTPFVEGDLLPAFGYYTNDTIEVSGTLYDIDAGVDSIQLYLDGGLVDSGSILFTGTASTSTVSYSASSLSNGLHTVMMTAEAWGFMDVQTYTYTNEWSFYWYDHFAVPATSALELYNVNMAGCVNSGVRTVADGGVLAAPTTGGSNVWNNAYSPNDPWGNPGAMFLADANGSYTNGIVFETGDGNWNDGPQSWAAYYDEFTALSNTIWGATQGDPNNDGFARFSGLDTNAAYDVYIYWTWNRADSEKTYSIVTGSANLPSASIATDRAALLSDPGNYVEGQNYVVIPEVTPNELGMIEISSNYSSAFQLVKRGTSTGPTVTPNMLPVSIGGGLVNLEWWSEAGINYDILSTTNLTDGIWNVEKSVIGTGDIMTDWLPLGTEAEKFYRIEAH